MEIIFGVILGAVVLPIAFVILLTAEQRDKRRRSAQGLPQKKYHDISDHDVYTVYTVHHGR